MNNNDYIKIMKFFPPVNPNIIDSLEEASISYNNNFIFPLKLLPYNMAYSPEIFNNLRMLRILLNSDLEQERFIYELNKMVNAWGPAGVYGENIINSNLLDSINIINIKETKMLEMKNIKEKEIMEESKPFIYEQQLKDLENQLENISFNFKNKKKKPISSKHKDDDDFGFSRLNINKKTILGGIVKNKNKKK